jgi:acetyltransferase-like isoleucine patch superfamily enzyme
MWTHGYYHADKGPERIRIDGEIKIGDNVYIGSSCIFNPGVVVSNSIHLGGGSVISKSLVKPGMYVTQGLRFIDNNIESIKNKLESVKEDNLMDNVYLKKNE